MEVIMNSFKKTVLLFTACSSVAAFGVDDGAGFPKIDAGSNGKRLPSGRVFYAKEDNPGIIGSALNGVKSIDKTIGNIVYGIVCKAHEQPLLCGVPAVCATGYGLFKLVQLTPSIKYLAPFVGYMALKLGFAESKYQRKHPFG
jgi:hypothetical protein